MFGPGFWGPAYWGKEYWPDGIVVTPPGPYTPTLTKSESRVVGTWRIDKVVAGTPKATLNLKELRGAITNELPSKLFDQDTYPQADDGIYGEPIPSVIGPVKGCTAFLIDAVTNTFKIVGHTLDGMGPFYDEEFEFFIPDTIDLVNGEFTFAAWDGTVQLFADAIRDGGNPVDTVKTLLTDADRGLGLSLDRLDTTSTGKGFGTNGARLDYIRGTKLVSGDEVYSFTIGLYMKEQKKVNEWIQQVAAAAFGIVYTDAATVYQYKAWKPVASEGLPEITIDTIIGNTVKPIFSMSDPVTEAVVKYAETASHEAFQVYTHTDDRLRQLRGLDMAASITRPLPLADRFGAVYWAERTVRMRGVPRYTLNVKVTQEFKTLEPGDNVRVVYDVLDIDTVFEVLSVKQQAGSIPVTLKLIDVRGFGDDPGFWTLPAPLTFPASVGGGSFSEWADADTAAKRKYVRENWGTWAEPSGYADEDNDPEDSYRASVWS